MEKKLIKLTDEARRLKFRYKQFKNYCCYCDEPFNKCDSLNCFYYQKFPDYFLLPKTE